MSQNSTFSLICLSVKRKLSNKHIEVERKLKIEIENRKMRAKLNVLKQL